MTLYAGTVDSFTGSMAEAIENAFAAELLEKKGTQLPASSALERRMLFCAIAQGVLGYLQANETDLGVTVDLDVSNTTHVVVDYEVSP